MQTTVKKEPILGDTNIQVQNPQLNSIKPNHSIDSINFKCSSFHLMTSILTWIAVPVPVLQGSFSTGYLWATIAFHVAHSSWIRGTKRNFFKIIACNLHSDYSFNQATTVKFKWMALKSINERQLRNEQQKMARW